MLVTVTIPTVAGREELLQRALRSYRDQDGVLVEVLIYGNQGACGYAWQRGLDQGFGDYVHFGADDVELAPGAFMAAIAAIERGQCPAPRVLWPDGSVQSCGDWGVEMEDGTEVAFSRGPMIKREWAEIAGPIPEDMHYYTDNLVSERLRRAGIPSVVCRGYEYVHHMAEAGRRSDTWASDRELYVRLMGSDPS